MTGAVPHPGGAVLHIKGGYAQRRYGGCVPYPSTSTAIDKGDLVSFTQVGHHLCHLVGYGGTRADPGASPAVSIGRRYGKVGRGCRRTGKSPRPSSWGPKASNG